MFRAVAARRWPARPNCGGAGGHKQQGATRYLAWASLRQWQPDHDMGAGPRAGAGPPRQTCDQPPARPAAGTGALSSLIYAAYEETWAACPRQLLSGGCPVSLPAQVKTKLALVAAGLG